MIAPDWQDKIHRALLADKDDADAFFRKAMAIKPLSNTMINSAMDRCDICDRALLKFERMKREIEARASIERDWNDDDERMAAFYERQRLEMINDIRTINPDFMVKK